MAKKRVKKRSKKVSSLSKKSVDKKYSLGLKDLIISVILFVASVLLYYVSNNTFASNLFYLLAILFGFISVAFLIVFLVFAFLKFSKK